MNDSIPFFRLALLFLLTFTLNSCTDLDDNLSKPEAEEVIKKDSGLFQLLENVVTDDNDPMESIVCIDFIYPFKVLIYDANLQVIGDKTLSGDIEFSAFLGALPVNQSISISYPMSTVLADGTVFSVNNNRELKLAIESCSREDIISYCNGLFGGNGQTKCVWKVPYVENGDNKYTGGVFEANENGTLRFSYNNEIYLGTWIFLFINDEFHININLEGITTVALDWNIDRKVEIYGDEIKIINTPKNIILRRSCETATEYEIGDIGPTGGTVFYDKGYYTLGWRYMEASNEDLTFYEWGCSSSSVTNASSSGIGYGLFNSAAIVNFHDNLQDYYNNPAVCNALNNGTVVAKKALLYSFNYQTDWFLPTAEELHLMYTNLHTQALGNFTNSIYWSATEVDQGNVKTVDFSTGDILSSPKIPVVNNIKARAIRYF